MALESSPLVSVIIPVRNRPALVEELLRSLQGQTYSHFEAIVVDDHSTDDTRRCVETLAAADSRIRCLSRIGDTPGAPACRNQGLAASRGEFVIFFDSDDLFAPDGLAQRVAHLLAHPDIDFSVSQEGFFDRVIGDSDLLFNRDTGEDDLDRFLRHDHPWSTSGPTWRRAALDRVGIWDEALQVGQDLDYAMRALVLGLRYRRLRTLTSFRRTYRVAWRQSVGVNPWSAAKLPSHERRLKKIHAMLIERGQLSPLRRVLLAGQFFWLAQQYHRHDLAAEGDALWRYARATRLITFTRYQQGRTFLASTHRWFAGLTLRYLCQNWPADMFVCNRETFANTRPGDESAPPEIPFQKLHPDPSYREALTTGYLPFIARRLAPHRLFQAVTRRFRPRYPDTL